MPEQVHSLQQIIKINGTPLDDSVAGYIREIVVDDRLQMPAVLTIRFDDIPGDLLDTKINAQLGSTIEFSATPVGESEPVKLFTGEVTALEGTYLEVGAQVVVRAYDKLQRLQHGRHTEAYQSVTDSDLARKIAQRNGLTPGDIGSTSSTYDHVAQANVSDWDFIKARAREIGFEVSLTDGKFNFRKPNPASDAPATGNLSSENPKQLAYHAELIEFHPRLTGGSQVKSITVRSWDPETKQEIVESAQADTKTVKLTDKPATVADAVSDSDPYVSVSIPVATNGGASKVAEAIAEELGSAFFEADGVAIGDPRLKAGTAVSISGVARKFSGGYVLSHVRHVFEHDFGYRIHFEISGRQERSLLGLTSLGQTNGQVNQTAQPIYGFVVGIVTNNKDDDKKEGRVKVRFPWLSPKSGQGAYESTWARLVNLGAGKNRGALFMPEVDDEVLVGFEHGDIHRPYVIGGLYNGVDKPDMGLDKGGGVDGLVDGSGKVVRRGFTSRLGHRIVFIDDDQTSGIAIKTSNGKLKIEFKEKDNELHITGDQKVIVTATQELTLESQKDLNIKAQGTLKLQASTGVDMKSDATFKIQGATVDLKGSGPVSVSGTPIKLN